MEEKINHLIKERAPWLAKKNFISLLIFNFLKKLLRFDETIYAGDYIQDLSCLLYTSPSPRDAHESRMPSSA